MAGDATEGSGPSMNDLSEARDVPARLARRRSGGDRDRDPSSMRARLDVLIGDRRRLVFALAITSILSGFAEAATLALVAQVAANLVNGTRARS